MTDFFKKQNPLLLCTFFLLAVTVSFFAGISSFALSLFLCVLFSVIAFYEPKNGFYLIVFFVPFFLGNSKREFYFFFEYCCIATLLASFSYLYKNKQKEILSVNLNYVYVAILLIVISLVLAIPINLKEFYYEVKGNMLIDPVTYIKNQLLLFSYGHEGKNVYWFRTLLNNVVGCSLFFIIPFLFTKDDMKNFIKCAVFSLLLTLIFGYLFYYDMVPHEGLYFSLSLAGKQHGVGMTAFSYNRGYLSQYLIMFFPFLLYLTYSYRKSLKSLLFVFLFFVVLKAVMLTTQRTALAVLLVQIFSIPCFFLLSKGSKLSKRHFASSLLFIFVFVAFLAFIDVFLLERHLSDRLFSLFKSLGQRSHIWKGAVIMWKNNLLTGAGLGKHHHFFPYYYPAALGSQLMVERTTAHNLYLHLLAERGLVGFCSFLLFPVSILVYGLIGFINSTGEKRFTIGVFLLAIIGFLGYGIGQYMLYVRSIAVSFWIFAGFVYLMIKPEIKTLEVSAKAKIAVLGVASVLLLHKLYVVATFSMS